jgi:hypothetical protein
MPLKVFTGWTIPVERSIPLTFIVEQEAVFPKNRNMASDFPKKMNVLSRAPS